jgi:hypothetical protein
MHRIVPEKMRESFGIGSGVYGHDLQVFIVGQKAQHVPPDSAESVHSYASHKYLPGS